MKKEYADINFTYVGDGRNNVANALMQGAAIMGMNFHLVCPKELNPTEELLNRCERIAAENGGNILITDDIDKGVKDSDVIYTDVWVSMGEPDEVWQERLKLLKPYQVNQALLEKQAIQMLFLNIVYLLSTMLKLKLVNKFMKIWH